MEEQYTQISSIISKIDNLNLRESKSGCFKFPIYLNEELSKTSVEMLELSTRSSNGLKRAGIHSIGQLCEKVSSRKELNQIRNLGVKSANEIMDHLFAYQYNKLPDERKNEYIENVIRMNTGG